MKRIVTLVVAFAIAAVCQGAVVVLKGGKRIDVASWEQRGSYVVVKYQGGRFESYPADAVDLAATQKANNIPPAPPSPTPAGPRSPFAAALASQGSAAASITDSDVAHPAPTEPTDEAKAGEQGKAGQGAQVVLVSYDKRKVGEDQWEVTATLANQGGAPASGVVVDTKLMGANNQVLGSGSATLAGNLAPQMQGVVTIRLAAQGEPVQIGFDLKWETIREVPPTPAPSPAVTPKVQPAQARPTPTPPTGYGLPPAAGPNSVPSNPNGMGPINQVPNPPQLAPPTAPPKG
ncbi:MAG: FxLYD domain-containing protein [Acidobacteriota bacterium]